jgi:hypothetical protein
MLDSLHICIFSLCHLFCRIRKHWTSRRAARAEKLAKSWKSTYKPCLDYYWRCITTMCARGTKCMTNCQKKMKAWCGSWKFSTRRLHPFVPVHVWIEFCCLIIWITKRGLWQLKESLKQDGSAQAILQDSRPSKSSANSSQAFLSPWFENKALHQSAVSQKILLNINNLKSEVHENIICRPHVCTSAW